MNGYGKYFLLMLLMGSVFSCSLTREILTLVLLPDTQGYSEKHPAIFHSQTRWIAEHADEIDFVLHQGDMTDDNNGEQWEVVKSAMSRLDGKVPYALAVGNHDMGSEPGKFADVRNSSLFNRYFPAAFMAGLPAFGGLFEEGRMDNAWYLLKKGRRQWIFLTLEFGPRESVLRWANDLVARHPDKTVVLNTHSYMYSDSTRQGGADHWRPQDYGIGRDSLENRVNDGEQIWQKLVKGNPNIRMVVSGHVLHSGVGTLVSVNDAGLPVYQFLANYQGGVRGSVNEGNGYLRIMKYEPRHHRLAVKSYSPWLDSLLGNPAHQFLIRDVFLESRKQLRR